MVLTSVIFSGLSFLAAAGLSSAMAPVRRNAGAAQSHGSEAAPPMVVSRSTSRRFMAGPFVNAQAKVCMIRRGAPASTVYVTWLASVICAGGGDVNLAALQERVDQPGRHMRSRVPASARGEMVSARTLTWLRRR